jgi:hypothetical protein
VLRLRGRTPELAGPCGPAPWYLEVGEGDDPMEVVTRLASALLGPPLVAHSTSWRRDRGTVLLSFVVVIERDQALGHHGTPIGRTGLARGSATAAPTVHVEQVIEHGLRHLAWLLRDDPVVAQALPQEWHRLLAGYVPEPFRDLKSYASPVSRLDPQR